MAEVKFLVGADPELFLKNDKGQLVSAHDILPGTKVSPYKVEHGAIQVDGVAAEFNIDPAETSRQFINNIDQVMRTLKVHAKGAEFSIEPYAVFEPSYFDTLPDLVKELGCNPDYNAWTGQVNPAPDGSGTMRTASGHVHIGWCKGVNPHDKLHFEDCCAFIKELDFHLGLYSMIWDTDNTRRQLYGKAGAFRPKPYGCEYRVMSNMWLKSFRVQDWIFNSIQVAATRMLSNKPSMVEKFGSYAQECIDNNVIDWWTTEKGKVVHNSTGLSFPDLRDFGKETPKLAPTMWDKKMLSAQAQAAVANTLQQALNG